MQYERVSARYCPPVFRWGIGAQPGPSPRPKPQLTQWRKRKIIQLHFATVEADSQEEAEEKWCDHQYVKYNDDCQYIDNVEICQEDEDKETVADIKPDNGQCDCGCTSADNDKPNSTLSNSGEDGMPSPHSLSCSQELKGGGD